MSNIEWTEKTWNPVIGCTRVSEGCRNCYAEVMARRLAAMAIKDGGKGRKANYLNVVKHDAMGTPLPQWNGKIELVEEALGDPLRWRKPSMIFVNSMSDLFHENVPLDYIIKVLAVCAICPQHTMQILTKRPERMVEVINMGDLGHQIYRQVQEWLDEGEQGFLGKQWDRVRELSGRSVTGGRHYFMAWNLPLKNVWLGTSVEGQATADKRIPHLLKCPAAIRFVSAEPLLGAVDIREWINCWCPNCGSDGSEGRFPQRNSGASNPKKRGAIYCPSCNKNMPNFPTIDREINGEWYTFNDIDWIIVGGESGPGARPCDIDHLLDVMYQCKQAGVACFIKQLGSKPVTSNANLYDFPDHVKFAEYGDAAASASIILKSPKGSDMSEWPEDLRVRQMPVDGGVS